MIRADAAFAVEVLVKYQHRSTHKKPSAERAWLYPYSALAIKNRHTR
jgi:hypothetical protein